MTKPIDINKRSFICKVCCHEYNATNTVSEAGAEYESDYGEPIGDTATVSLCDRCYEDYMENRIEICYQLRPTRLRGERGMSKILIIEILVFGFGTYLIIQYSNISIWLGVILLIFANNIRFFGHARQKQNEVK